MHGLPLLLAAVLASPAPSPAKPDLALARQGLARAAAAGTLAPAEVSAYRATLTRLGPLLKSLPPLRVKELEGVLHDVAAQSKAYTPPRALVLFTTLAENEDYLTSHRLPGSGTDVLDADGVLYREFPGHGLVFHPLGNFARLNGLVAAGQTDAAAQLAAALVARGIPTGNSLRFEYEFPFSVGPAPWTSGMAQAVGAQALAKAGDKLGDPALLTAAAAVYRAVPTLMLDLPQGPWIRLYNWSRYAVLNAQLQTIVSLADYASASGNVAAGALAARLQQAAVTLLPQFDTGFWSLYSLDGSEAPLSYHQYVVTLLKRLAVVTGDQTWRDAADRFTAYETEPPQLHAGPAAGTIYPDPQDGYKDVAPLRFWLSKRSSVMLRAGKTVETLSFGHGWNVFPWSPGFVAPGLYHPRLEATDLAGNRAALPLDPVDVRIDATAPLLTVEATSPSTVHWEAQDDGTPWLDLTVRLARGKTTKLLELGKRGLAGTAHLTLPPGRWRATFLASNSAGRTRSVPLGMLPR
jgi:D-glucuronyl C5-epimerase-like protein